MTKAGIPVPPGFIVLSTAFEKFIEETNLNVEIDSILNKVKHEDISRVEITRDLSGRAGFWVDINELNDVAM